jgi:capsule polysaccharide export protein KpsE/RkpR
MALLLWTMREKVMNEFKDQARKDEFKIQQEVVDNYEIKVHHK